MPAVSAGTGGGRWSARIHRIGDRAPDFLRRLEQVAVREIDIACGGLALGGV